ncbi:hypothetical protein [Tautonia plasticadhaerens]|uniref:Uncharacterized protein n=1 Tax=Tautonia plasticadhaerens TaxID=2527974 RepID=A0A518H7S5_9BACT|nr:hypothetical protein [Tautonia plasticadhaerens]QDV36902.1 hypothetical protein ElP_48320 [Tautonia plasticadhaerens]
MPADIAFLRFVYELPDGDLFKIASGYGTWADSEIAWEYEGWLMGSKYRRAGRGDRPDDDAGSASVRMPELPGDGTFQGAEPARWEPTEPFDDEAGMCPDGGQPWMGDPCYEFLVTPDYSGDLVAVAC